MIEIFFKTRIIFDTSLNDYYCFKNFEPLCFKIRRHFATLLIFCLVVVGVLRFKTYICRSKIKFLENVTLRAITQNVLIYITKCWWILVGHEWKILLLIPIYRNPEKSVKFGQELEKRRVECFLQI
ncbi:hypothetical protein RF11_09285 [Thelohanellus kitauei]|uniref:Uncharacterized protein n=1 Tax=Thelohanellus kitauei TaxID=669202 RepID=A0A0C2MKE9_THEKT|nr:hypothetical protein RF11_09285 [Thelohanellus kitauei]